MRHPLAIAAALLPLTLLAGCRVDREAGATGEHVHVSTPFGGLQVRTDEQAIQGSLGLPGFPGATPIAKSDDKDGGAADVDLALGALRFRIKVLRFRTASSPTEVRDFYTKALTRFGPIITCQNHHPLGTPTHTPEGLTCNDSSSAKADPDPGNSGALELKAGSPEHQHLVAIEPGTSRDTTFTLIALDLPRHLAVDTDIQ